MKCNNCLNARMIISENGMHPLCCLSVKDGADCILGKVNHQLTLEKEEKVDITTRGIKE